MELVALEIGGFKSFAKTTRLRFGKGLTAVIGPNGSGKSNLAEAMRWVLGEQSVKQLRSKTSQDVIFAGNAQAAASRKAAVTLTFSNEDGRFPVDAPEVSITRLLTRQGDSEYSINGDRVRLIDLQQMLAEAGIGAKTYTVISQGMVDRYLTATAEARRELFDEATGIKALQIRAAQAARKLEQAHQHAEELHTILHELKPRLSVLARQAEQFTERQTLQQDFAAKQALWLHSRWAQQAAAVVGLEQAYQSAAGRIQKARTERERIERNLLAGPAQPDPAWQLQQELHHAQTTWARAQAAYEQAMAERHHLEASLAEIAQQLQQAEITLHHAREESVRFDWLKQSRLLLRQCKTWLQDWRAGKPAEERALAVIEAEIDRFLTASPEEEPLAAARALLQQFEKPLQEVARLQAIQAERTDQLKKLTHLMPPSPDAVRQLEAALAAQTAPAGNESDQLAQTLAAAREEELAGERHIATTQAELEHARTTLADTEQEILRELGTAQLQQIQHQPAPPQTISETEMRGLHKRLAALGEIDPLALKEYAEVKERYEHLSTQLADIEATQERITELMAQLRAAIEENFASKFSFIQKSFAVYFERLFGGGKAHLSLTEDQGINITVSPPGKRLGHVHLLSGGEKALTSLALLLAILEVQQPPFLVLDEVDAALDEANTLRFAEMLKEKSAATQCIVISHNRQTMGQAEVLYGVMMGADGISKIYAVKVEDLPAQSEAISV